LGAALVGLVVVCVTTAIDPLVGVAVALFLGPLRAYLAAEVAQVPAQIAHPFLLLALASWLASDLARRELRIPHPPLILPLVIFVGAALLSLWDAVELPVYGIPELIKWLQVLLLFLFVSHHLTRRRLPWLMGTLLATGLFQALVGLWQFGLRGEGPEHFAILGERFYRAYGTFEQPNPYAGYLGLMLPLALGLMWGKATQWRSSRRTPKGREHGVLPLLLVAIPALVMLAALGTSWSRGGWMGFAAAVSVMAIALPRRASWGLLLVAALLVGGIGLYAVDLLPAPVAARLGNFAQYVQFEDVRGVGINDANYAVIERLAHWQSALSMLRHNPWTGVGFGCYEPAYARFALINWPIALGHAHNYYLNLAAETGLIGLGAYLSLWTAVLWRTWRATRHTQGLMRGLAIGLLGTWTHLSVHNFLDNLYVNNVHLHIGVLLGVLAFMLQQTQSNDH
jgi:O-antigen ligase